MMLWNIMYSHIFVSALNGTISRHFFVKERKSSQNFVKRHLLKRRQGATIPRLLIGTVLKTQLAFLLF